MHFMQRVFSACALLLVAAGTARAQVPWETPQLLAPHAPKGVSLLATSYAAAPDDGWGVVVAVRTGHAPSGVGFRIVGGRGRGGENAIGGGIEAARWITRASAAFPVDIIAMTGIGGSYGHSAQIALPIGISAARSLGDDEFWCSPYVAARAVIEGRLGGSAPADELDLQIATELGANISFDRNRNFVMRLAAALGDRSALALGVHLGAGPRRAAVQASAARN
ncbi:MAG TPA: hypothetical protein VFZ04_15360 [Longimicrobiales bacterium]